MTATQLKYQAYLDSDHWHRLRRGALDKAGFQCQNCGSRKRLQCHHTRYRNRWEDTQPGDLKVLCRKCHAKTHGKAVGKRKKVLKRIDRNVPLEERRIIFTPSGFMPAYEVKRRLYPKLKKRCNLKKLR